MILANLMNLVILVNLVYLVNIAVLVNLENMANLENLANLVILVILVANFATNESGAILWPTLQLMQVATSGGQICN